MSIPVNIESLINKRVVESSRIEFIEGFNPDSIIRTICAFANDIDNIGGGYIIIGVEEDNGTPVIPVKGIDIKSVDGIMKKLREYCHYIEPLYEPAAEPVNYDGKTLIVIRVSGGCGRPYKAPKEVTSKHPEKHYYIRKFSGTAAASREEEKELFYLSSNIPFDDRPNLAADVEDMDIGLLRAHLKEIGSALYEQSKGRSITEIAADMQLVEGPPEALRPKNAGILMFSEQPEKYFRYARIEVVDIPDPTGTNMTEKIFTGPIQRQLKDALLYIKNYIIKESVVKKSDKAEAERVFNYPYAAVEEILANAVYHRSYQISEPITVRITKNFMEITSFPGFDRSISDDAILNFDIRAKAYRNRRIGDFLKELHLIEGRNTGFPNAISALKNNGSDNLKIEMDPERTYVSVTIPVHKIFLENKPEKYYEYETGICDCLRETPLTLTELALAMGYKGISVKLKNSLEGLVENGQIKKVAGEGNHVKYIKR